MPPAKKAGKCTHFVRHFVTPSMISRNIGHQVGHPQKWDSERLKPWDVNDLLAYIFEPCLGQDYNVLTLTSCARAPVSGVSWPEALTRGFDQCPVSISPPTLPASFPIALPCLPLLWPQARVLITGVLPTKTRKLGAKEAWGGNQSCSVGAKSHLTAEALEYS